MVLLDTHALLWLVRDDELSSAASRAIEAAQLFDRLYVSPITAWELGAADQKRTNRPGLGMAPAAWFRMAMQRTGARLAAISVAVAAEAASIPAVYGRGDPGDCLLIAAARVRRLTLVTRDRAIIRLSNDKPDFLSVVVC